MTHIPYPLVLFLPRKFRWWFLLFWWVTIIGLWVTILGMVGDHPWQLSPGISFVSSVKVPNSKFVVYVLMVGDHPWVGG